jgi:hypothetical protein
VHRGGMIAFLEGLLADSEGATVATATATARIVAIDGPLPQSPSAGSLA